MDLNEMRKRYQAKKNERIIVPNKHDDSSSVDVKSENNQPHGEINEEIGESIVFPNKLSMLFEIDGDAYILCSEELYKIPSCGSNGEIRLFRKSIENPMTFLSQNRVFYKHSAIPFNNNGLCHAQQFLKMIGLPVYTVLPDISLAFYGYVCRYLNIKHSETICYKYVTDDTCLYAEIGSGVIEIFDNTYNGISSEIVSTNYQKDLCLGLYELLPFRIRKQDNVLLDIIRQPINVFFTKEGKITNFQTLVYPNTTIPFKKVETVCYDGGRMHIEAFGNVVDIPMPNNCVCDENYQLIIDITPYYQLTISLVVNDITHNFEFFNLLK